MCDQTENIKVRQSGLAAGGYASELPGGSKYFFQTLRTIGFTKDGKMIGWTRMKLFKKDKPVNVYCESLKNPMLKGEPLKPFPDEFEHEQLRVDAEIQRAYLRKAVSKGESGDFASIDSLIVGQCKDLRMLKKCYMWARNMYEAGADCPDIIKVLSACFTQPRLFLQR